MPRSAMEFTTTQLGTMVAVDTLAAPLMLDALLVKAAGLAPQLALVCEGMLVTFTVTVQLDTPAAIFKPLTVIMLPPVTTVVAAAALLQVPPTVVLATARPLGSVSTKLTLRAGVPEPLLTVKVSTVVPPELIVV